MEKRRGNQALGIAALFIAVIGLSLGFAAFSNTLTIRSSATVVPANTELDVDFATAADGTVDANGLAAASRTQLTGQATANDTTDDTYIGTGTATIDNSVAGQPVISGLHATFTAPGQSATYEFYAYNTGHLVAYLKDITFNTTAGNGDVKGCTIATTLNGVAVPSAEQATQSLVTAACPYLTVSIKVDTVEQTPTTVVNTTKVDATSISSDNSLAVGAAHKITVTLAYESTENYVDGPVDVIFPAIKLTYSSTNS